MRNPFKINSDQKKNIPEIRSQKYKIPPRIVKLGTIFEKTVSSRVILKIVGATPQLDQNFKPITNLSRQFFYIYLSIYGYSVTYTLK